MIAARLAPTPGGTALPDGATLDAVASYYDEQFDDEFGGLRAHRSFRAACRSG